MSDETEKQAPDVVVDVHRLGLVNTRVDVVHKPGVEKLEGFPLLAWAPFQHPGKGVHTEDNGSAVADICVMLATNPDLAAVAAHFGTTVPHVQQAHDYALHRLTVLVPDLAPETVLETAGGDVIMLEAETAVDGDAGHA